MANLVGDVIELTVDITGRNLRAGMQGTIVHCHAAKAYEVEFINEGGETVELLALRPEQFIVVWQAETQEWISTEQQAIQLISRLPHDAAKEVLDFARFLSVRGQKKVSDKTIHINK